MQGRRKGGLREKLADEFDRSSPFTLASLADEWLQHMEERNYSKQTLSATHWALKMFLDWAHERSIIDPSTITKATLESYQRWIYRYRKSDGEPLSFRTQRMRLGALQRFFSHLCKSGYLPANPASDLELPRKPYQMLPKALNDEELKALMSLHDVTDVMGLRDRTMLELLYATGIRRSELVALDVPDVDRIAASVYIRKGKGGKGRLLPVGSCALHWLEVYLERSRPALAINMQEQALFLSGYGERFSPGYIGNWVSRSMREPLESPRKAPVTFCATPAQRTCWKTERISASSSKCSDMPDWTPRRFTPKSVLRLCAMSTIARTPTLAIST
jgi:integrase/recombinase XerD